MDAPDGTMARPVAPAVEADLDLDGGVAARVEDLAPIDLLDLAHVLDKVPVRAGEVGSLGALTLRPWPTVFLPERG